MTNETRDIRIKRLLYQSWYRGCKETDKILGLFARKEIETLSDAELDEFEMLMSENDHDIFGWITGKFPIPEKYRKSAVMQKILLFDFSAPQD